MDKAIEYACVLRCPQLHALAGLAPEGTDWNKCMGTYVENLGFAAAALAEHGVWLLIEAVNTRDFPGYILSRTAHALEVIETVASDNLFLQYDVYHVQIMEGNLAETIRANIKVISHFQIAGVPWRHEPDVGEINYKAPLKIPSGALNRLQSGRRDTGIRGTSDGPNGLF